MRPASVGALLVCVGVLPCIEAPPVCTGELSTWACGAGEYGACCCVLLGFSDVSSAGKGLAAATACVGINDIFSAPFICMAGAQAGAGAGAFRDFTSV